MTHHFKITFWKIIKGLFALIFFLVFFIVAYFFNYSEDKFDSYLIWFSVSAIIIFAMPSLILLINHLSKSYSLEIIIDYNEQIITILDGSKVIKYKIEQLHKVTHVQTISYPLICNITVLWSIFGYLKFEFEDNKVFYLSSLAVNLKKLNSLKIDATDSFFPLIKY